MKNKTEASKKIFGVVLLMSIFMGILAAFAQMHQEAQKKEKKGLITYSDGRVRKKEITEEDWQPAQVNSSILTGDKIRTYTLSRAELELLELDVIRMAPETIIDIVKLYEETKTQQTETKINLEQGDIWAKINKKDKDAKFDISAPVAVAAITGTVLRMNVSADSSTELKVYTGEVKITNAPENTSLVPQMINVHEVPGPYEVPGPREVSMEEWIYIVKNMQKIVLDKNGKVQNVGKFSLSDQDEQSSWVRWNLQRDQLR